MKNNTARLWERVQSRLQEQLEASLYRLWIKPLCATGTGEGLVLSAPNRFAQEQVTHKYLELIRQLAAEETGHQVEVSLQTRQPKKAPALLSGDVRINPRYNFDTFIVGNNNRLAHAAALAVAQSPATTYNPLFIYGDVGLGKTHLLQAIAHFVLERRPELTFTYVSSEQFTNELINSIRDDKTISFRRKHRSADILLVDDIHFLAGKERTQEEFFHTFNALYEAHKQICISSDRPPTEIPTLEKRLRSRFEWGLITDIQPPDLETRIAILKKKAETEDMHLPDEVASFIAERVKTNIRKLEGCLMRLFAHTSLYHQEVTLDSAKKTLASILSPKEAKLITPEMIQEKVAGYYRLRPEELTSKKRVKSVALPRQVAMYLCRELTSCSFPEIGKQFGGKDHTTIMYACRKIKKALEDDRALSRDIEALIERVNK